MKKLIRIFKQACWKCHGMGVIEMPNGETKECHICKGKGIV